MRKLMSFLYNNYIKTHNFTIILVYKVINY